MSLFYRIYGQNMGREDYPQPPPAAVEAGLLLNHMQRRMDLLERKMQRQAYLAIALGFTWADIGVVLACDAESAHARFAPVVVDGAATSLATPGRSPRV